jgi:hypothetical protein
MGERIVVWLVGSVDHVELASPGWSGRAVARCGEGRWRCSVAVSEAAKLALHERLLVA